MGQKEETDVAIKVIADHSRALAFLLADGALPSNEGRGYVVRRILRRAARFGKVLGIDKPFLYRLAQVVAEVMADTFPEVQEHLAFTSQVIQKEEERFLETLDFGLKLLTEEIDRLRQQERNRSCRAPWSLNYMIPMGFPLDIIQDVIRDQNLSIDQARFSDPYGPTAGDVPPGLEGKRGTGDSRGYRTLMARDLKNEFMGYDTLETESHDSRPDSGRTRSPDQADRPSGNGIGGGRNPFLCRIRGTGRRSGDHYFPQGSLSWKRPFPCLTD